MKQIEVARAHQATRYTLKQALLLYSSATGDYGGGSPYATVHDVKNVDGRAVIEAGRPVTTKAVGDCIRALGRRVGMQGWTSDRVLYIAPGALVWWRPAAPRAVFFSKDSGGDKVKIGARSAITPHPPLVFAVAGERWYVWAFDDRGLADGFARPKPQTPLAHAPYFNVWDQGKICTGNVKLPDTITPETLTHFEDAFFDSRFTHPNHKHTTSHPQGPYALWRELLDGAHHHFPCNHLAPAKLTLEQAVARVMKGRE